MKSIFLVLTFLTLSIGNLLSQTITSASSELIGQIDSTGLVYDFDNNQIGQFLPDGYVLDGNNDTIGKIVDSTFYDINSMYIGYISGEGNVYNLSGDMLGYISEDSKIYDRANRLQANYSNYIDKKRLAGFYFFYFVIFN